MMDEPQAQEREEFLDTQVVSYAFKGALAEPIYGDAISSIVACEFLIIQSGDASKARYYVPLSSRYSIFGGDMVAGIPRITRPFRKVSTDSVVMEFGPLHRTVVEFSNLAISQALNGRNIGLFVRATQHLDKRTRKILRNRFEFLLDHDVRCFPLNPAIVEYGFFLLQEFLQRHNLKSAFRNSWNDILILSTAHYYGGQLVTKDNELARFAAGSPVAPFGASQGFSRFSFEAPESSPRRASRESKGYINRQCRARFLHYH